jgi:hypothetical protein
VAFVKGQLQNGQATGRPKGSTNTITREVKSILLNIINDNLDQIRLDIMQLEPRDRVAAIIQLAKLILPKVKPQENENEQSDELKQAITVYLNTENNEINN